MPYEEPLPRKGDQPEGRGEQDAREVVADEDLEAESKREHVDAKDEGPVENVKEKGKELLDKISGPDVPPTLRDDDKKV
jgi:hypothetical protein